MKKIRSHRIVGFLVFGVIFISQTFASSVYSASAKRPAVPPVDNRKFFESKTDIDLPGCGQDFNEDRSNTTSTYKNKAKGIQLDLPYNRRWGSDKYKIHPYYYSEASLQDDQPARISFGPLIPSGEAMACFIKWGFDFESHESAAVVMRRLARENKDNFYIQPKLRRVNGLSVISYAYNGSLSGDAHVIVIGKKYNYHFSTTDDIKEDFFPTMEKVIKTVKLIK